MKQWKSICGLSHIQHSKSPESISLELGVIAVSFQLHKELKDHLYPISSVQLNSSTDIKIVSSYINLSNLYQQLSSTLSLHGCSTKQINKN